jgi:hypothetical protein
MHVMVAGEKRFVAGAAGVFSIVALIQFFTAAAPVTTASVSSSSPRRDCRACPVCSVSVRNPSATLKRHPSCSSESAYIIRALAKVLPHPVDAILMPKKPCSALFRAEKRNVPRLVLPVKTRFFRPFPERFMPGDGGQ